MRLSMRFLRGLDTETDCDQNGETLRMKTLEARSTLQKKNLVIDKFVISQFAAIGESIE